MTFAPELRRRFLSTLATAGAVGLAGCPAGGPTYQFSTYDLGADLAAVAEQYYTEDLAEISANHAIDYPDEYKQSVVETLIREGSVEVTQLPLAYDREFGTTSRPRPRFTVVDGTYYLIVQENEQEILEALWVFYLDLIDDTPESSSTVVSGPPSSLSQTDRKIVESAMESVAASRNSPLDADQHGFPPRGVRFHEHMNPDASDLVPDPPFDYLEEGDHYFAANAEQGEVTLDRYEFSARGVATTREELEAFFADEFVDARFEASELPASVVDVLDTATDVDEANRYSDDGSMSDGLEAIVDRLGMLEYIPENDSYTELSGTVFWYDGRWYEGELTIK